VRALPFLAAALAACASGEAPAISEVTVDGTALRVRKPDGTFAARDELVGALLVARVDGGVARAVRIDSIRDDPAGGVLLYAFSARDEAGAWRPLCEPDAEGARLGFPLAGVWTGRGEHVADAAAFELACTSGAIGKCVRMGYRPWTGARAWRQHQACTRMVRADYCGDGVSHTRDGTAIDVFDADGIQRDEPAPGMSFEAAWSEHGAVCARRTRVPELLSVDELRAACGDRVPSCEEEDALRHPAALVFDRS
jgi:hypothetical protein